MLSLSQEDKKLLDRLNKHPDLKNRATNLRRDSLQNQAIAQFVASCS